MIHQQSMGDKLYFAGISQNQEEIKKLGRKIRSIHLKLRPRQEPAGVFVLFGFFLPDSPFHLGRVCSSLSPLLHPLRPLPAPHVRPFPAQWHNPDEKSLASGESGEALKPGKCQITTRKRRQSILDNFVVSPHLPPCPKEGESVWKDPKNCK